MGPTVGLTLMRQVNALHYESPPNLRWTTRNYSEALPGVPTPLSWSFWQEATERGAWYAFGATGLFSRREISTMRAEGTMPSALFFGRYAGNLDLLSQAVARTPGQDPAAFERDFFGVVDPAAAARKSRRRAVFAIVGGLRTVRRTRTLVEERYPRARTDWANLVARLPDAGLDEARAALRHAREGFASVMEVHGFTSQLAQRSYHQLARVCASLGEPGSEMTLSSGDGHLEEVGLAQDLWACAHGDLDIAVFLDRHGYHGPSEGELSSHSWREQPEPVLALLDTYRSGELDNPSEILRRRRDQRCQLMADLGRRTNPLTKRRLVHLAARTAELMAARERGKASFLMMLDLGRAAARRIGAIWATDGVLESPDDVFYLTFDEVLQPPRTDLVDLVRERRELRSDYETTDVPPYWHGNPERLPLAVSDRPSSRLEGLGVSAGVAVGTARVITDPARVESPVGPDEILVARTTDPSWVTLFASAGGMVVDIGGAMSHAAIVARELGVPCVINTEVGTSVIPDGALVRLDGQTGVVEIVAHENDLDQGDST